MTTEVLWISGNEIESLNIPMKDVIDAVETGFATLGRGEGELPPKIGIYPRKDSFIHAMPCYLGGRVDRAGIKSVSAYPANPAKGLPYISGVMVLLDAETGLPIALMNAAGITAMRTAAASGVYARHFGDPDTESIAIVGTGVQGRANLLAMMEIFPKLTTVRCYGVREESVQRFIDDMAPGLPEAEFISDPSLQAAVSEADVVLTCTPMSKTPDRPITRKMLKDTCLSIAVDYDASFHADVFRDSHFTCDNHTQYTWTREQGPYFQNGYPGPNEIDADMGEICAGNKTGVRHGRRGAVLMGIAAHDVMTAKLIHERAESAGIGTKVEL